MRRKCREGASCWSHPRKGRPRTGPMVGPSAHDLLDTCADTQVRPNCAAQLQSDYSLTPKVNQHVFAVLMTLRRITRARVIRSLGSADALRHTEVVQYTRVVCNLSRQARPALRCGDISAWLLRIDHAGSHGCEPAPPGIGTLFPLVPTPWRFLRTATGEASSYHVSRQYLAPSARTDPIH